MCLTALIGTAIGGVAQASAAKSAARAQRGAAERQVDLAERVYEEQKGMFQPYYQAGTNALGALQYELGMGDQPEGYQGFRATPGYQFRFGEGQRAIDTSAAARGQLFSGNTLRALTQYGQGVGSAEYGNYMNRLSGLTGAGQSAAGQQAAAGGAYGQQAGQAFGAMGNAAAAGAIGGANALTGAINSGIGLWQYQNLLNQ